METITIKELKEKFKNHMKDKMILNYDGMPAYGKIFVFHINGGKLSYGEEGDDPDNIKILFRGTFTK